jgi:hypothetical protein
VTLEGFLKIVLFQTALSAIVAVVCFYKYSKRHTYIRLIGFVFLIGFLANVAAAVLKSMGLNRLINVPQNIYLVTNFCLLSAVYFHILKKKAFKWFVSVAIAFVILALLNGFYLQKAGINSYTNVIQSLVIIVYSVIYFYRLMVELPEQHIHHLPMFWFNSAFLIFHAGAFFLFAFTSYLTNVLKNDLLTYWSFHNILNIIEHLVVLVGLYYDLKSLKVNKGHSL